MRFKRRVGLEAGLKQIDIAPLIDCVFLLLIFFMLTSSFVVVHGINVKLPKTYTSEEVKKDSITVTVSSEDIMYVDGAIVTEDELRQYLLDNPADAVFIKAAQDSSLGVVVVIWDLCKKAGISNIGIASSYK